MFVNGNHIGGYDNTAKAQAEGRLAKMLHPEDGFFNFFFFNKIKF